MRLCCRVLDGVFERFWRAHFWCFVCLVTFLHYFIGVLPFYQSGFILARFCGRGLLFLRFGGAESLNFACFRALTSIFYASEYAARRGFDERDADLL